MNALFISTLLSNPFEYLAWIIIVMFSICLHEYFHAAMALRLGDDTAASQGHLSMNPLRQMGLSSMIMLVLVGIAWGAVPVDPRRVPHRWGAAMVSFAGPAANLLLCVVFGVISSAIGVGSVASEAPNPVLLFFYLGSVANGVLFLFNMLPVPLFDGWSVFSMLFPGMQRISPQSAQTMTWIFILAVFATPAGALIWNLGTSLAQIIISGSAQVFRLFL
ncbi:MAG: site-2 protease family protein [Lentisphaerota bacterium]